MSSYVLRFVTYSIFGTLAFATDLGLLFLLTEYLVVPYWLSVPVAFLIATSTHYAAVRVTAFKDTTRSAGVGYLYFIFIMTGNALLITLLVTGLVELLGAPLYPARIGVAALVGIWSFFLNSKYTFKVP